MRWRRMARFVDRYVSACGAGALARRRIGLYSHSAVGRDVLPPCCAIGAEVAELGRSETFIPVDTDAVDPDTRTHIAEWVADEGLDALVSTDGDSNRPLLADGTGTIVPGDVIGQITAERLAAEGVVTPSRPIRAPPAGALPGSRPCPSVRPMSSRAWRSWAAGSWVTKPMVASCWALRRRARIRSSAAGHRSRLIRAMTFRWRHD